LSGRLVRASYAGASTDRAFRLLQAIQGRSADRWCRAHEPQAHCLSLLSDGMGFSSTDRLTVALGFAFDPMRESLAEALQETLNPQFFYTVVITGMVSWVALAAAPEPVFSKVAALTTAVLLAYLGGKAFLKVLAACFELKQATDKATTFQELEEAGVRFGRVLGPQGARVFILAVTVALGRGTVSGTSWLASRLPVLPSFTEASALSTSQVGLKLAAVEQVSAVAVVEGNLVIALAPTAVAMATMDGSGEGGAPRSPRVSGEELAKLRREFEAIKSRFWKNEAAVNATAYTPENLARMRNGKPPIGPEGYPMELHHKVPLAEGGTNSFANLAIKTRTEHRLGPNYKQNHPNLP
jgi:hypothetical protein